MEINSVRQTSHVQQGTQQHRPESPTIKTCILRGSHRMRFTQVSSCCRVPGCTCKVCQGQSIPFSLMSLNKSSRPFGFKELKPQTIHFFSHYSRLQRSHTTRCKRDVVVVTIWNGENNDKHYTGDNGVNRVSATSNPAGI